MIISLKNTCKLFKYQNGEMVLYGFAQQGKVVGAQDQQEVNGVSYTEIVLPGFGTMDVTIFVETKNLVVLDYKCQYEIALTRFEFPTPKIAHEAT